MIRFRMLNVDFRLHVLSVISLVLASALGVKRELPYLAMAICFHELMHILTAQICGLKIEYIELMWFGGAAHIGDVYSARPARIIITALAGPMGNLILATSAAALGWWEYLAFDVVAIIIRTNLLLMLFNLMPALPLDGGRVFFAVATRWLKPALAIKICVGMAMVLAAGMAALTIAGWMARGIVNLTFVLMSVFLISASINEYRTYREGRPGRVLEALCSDIPLPAPAFLVAFPADGRYEDAARFLMKDKPVVFAMVEDGGIRSLEYGETVARRIFNGANT